MKSYLSQLNDVEAELKLLDSLLDKELSKPRSIE